MEHHICTNIVVTGICWAQRVFFFGLHRRETEKLTPKFNNQNSTPFKNIQYRKSCCPSFCLYSAHTYGRRTSENTCLSAVNHAIQAAPTQTTTTNADSHCQRSLSSPVSYRVNLAQTPTSPTSIRTQRYQRLVVSNNSHGQILPTTTFILSCCEHFLAYSLQQLQHWTTPTACLHIYCVAWLIL